MAEAVAAAMTDGSHLLVQAGTGTGKSLAYLVPALLHGDTVVVATATIALQNQVVDRDLPALVDAVEPLLGRRPTYAILKGRSNYLCRNKVLGGMPDDDGRRAVRPVAHDGARAGTWCGCAAGPRRPRPATGTSSTPVSTTGPGGRSASPRASAWARRSARSARSASPSWPATGRPRSRSS
jgi:Rad3-related DNA helicase